MQLPAQSVRTRILPCLWSALLTGLEAIIYPQPFESTGELSFHARIQENDCYRVFKYEAEWEEIVIFVSLNPGCYMVEGTACMFGVVLSGRRDDVNNWNHQLVSQNWRFLIVWKERTAQIRKPWNCKKLVVNLVWICDKLKIMRQYKMDNDKDLIVSLNSFSDERPQHF